MAPADPHRPSGAPARDLRAVLGPGQPPSPSLPSSLLVPLIVTVISTWSEAQSWSLLLFLPHLSPASQLLADVCVCVSQPGTALSRTWRRRGRPHAGYATQPLSREGPLLYFHLWCSPSKCKYQLGQAAWPGDTARASRRFFPSKHPTLNLPRDVQDVQVWESLREAGCCHCVTVGGCSLARG